jgi:hypothetical protein
MVLEAISKRFAKRFDPFVLYQSSHRKYPILTAPPLRDLVMDRVAAADR